MMITRYDFPCPNNKGRYDLSMDELVELLDKAYENGLTHGKQAYEYEYVAAAAYENKDDSTRWKEAWIK